MPAVALTLLCSLTGTIEENRKVILAIDGVVDQLITTANDTALSCRNRCYVARVLSNLCYENGFENLIVPTHKRLIAYCR